MPISTEDSVWRSSPVVDTDVKLVYDFLNREPSMAYSMEEIMAEFDVTGEAVAEKTQEIVDEEWPEEEEDIDEILSAMLKVSLSVSRETADAFDDIRYYRLILHMLMEREEVEGRAVTEEDGEETRYFTIQGQS